MNERLDTQLNGAAQRNQAGSTPASSSSPTRAARPGMFTRLLSDFRMQRSGSATALVRRGQSVTFNNIPFFDQFGNRLDPDDPESYRRTERSRRAQRPQSPRSNDSYLAREMALSDNHRAAALMPSMKKRAMEHLLLTDQLRMGILSGDVETPGNKSGVLRKRLAEERKEKEPVDSVWLQEVRSHLGSSAEKDAARLVAQAKAMQGDAEDLEKAMNRTRKELKNPRELQVQPFQPRRVKADGTLVPEKVKQTGNTEMESNAGKAAPSVKEKDRVKANKPLPGPTFSQPSFKGEIGESPSLDHGEKASSPKKVRKQPATLPASELLTRLRSKTGIARASAWSPRQAVREDDVPLRRQPALTTPREVSRVSVERSTETRTDFEKASPAESQPAKATSRAGRLSTRLDPGVAERVRPRQQIPQAPKSVSVTEGAPAQQTAEQVKAGSIAAGATDGSTEKSPAQARPRSSSRVSSMRQSGWHIHTPSAAKSNGGTDTQQAVESARPNSKSPVKRSPAQSEKRTRSEKAAASKPAKLNSKSSGNEDSQSAKPGVSKTSFITSLGSKAAPKAGRPSPAQGLQNLHELMQKISTQAKVLKGDGIVRMQVPLKPGKLGNLLLSVIRSGGKYIVKLTAERPDAARSIEQHLPALREHLANQGITVERVEVETGQTRNQESAADEQRRDASEKRPGSRSSGRQASFERDSMDGGLEETEQSQRSLRTGLNTVDYVG